MTALINLTPHPLVVFDGQGNILCNYQPTIEKGLRVSQTETIIGSFNNVPIVDVEWGRLTPSPEILKVKDGDIVVVSTIVAENPEFREWAREHNLTVYVPNTGPTDLGAVRDAERKIVGVRSLRLVSLD